MPIIDPHPRNVPGGKEALAAEARGRRKAGYLGPFPSTPEGAPTPAFGERSDAPSGLRPSSFVMCNTPVEVQFITSAGCLNYPCRTPTEAKERATAASPVGRAKYNEFKGPFLSAVKAGLE